MKHTIYLNLVLDPDRFSFFYIWVGESSQGMRLVSSDHHKPYLNLIHYTRHGQLTFASPAKTRPPTNTAGYARATAQVYLTHTHARTQKHVTHSPSLVHS